MSINMTLLWSVMGSIPDVIRLTEKTITASKAGAEKLELAKIILGGLYEMAGGKQEDFLAFWPTVARVVSATVAVFNRSGTLGKQEG